MPVVTGKLLTQHALTAGGEREVRGEEVDSGLPPPGGTELPSLGGQSLVYLGCERLW